MPVILKNNTSSTLATAITTSDTGIVVANGSQFPVITAGEYFYATLVSQAGTTEIIKVTARVGNSMTVVRAQDGSSAASFQVGTLVEMRVNAASIAELRDEAVEISIADAGGYYTATTVEGALAEVAQDTLSRADAAALLADTTLSYSNVSAGDVVRTRKEGFAYVVATSGVSNQHVTTAGGVKLYVQPPFNVAAFGTVGDGVADDTAVIQKALTAARLQGGQLRKLFWPRGTYLVTGQLTLGAYQYIEFDPGVIVNLVPTSNVEDTSLFAVANQVNVHLYGNGATLNGTRAGAVTEGNASAFFLYGSDNVSVVDFNINNFATDGIIIWGDDAASGPCRNVLIKGCVVKNCRRNGMSIIDAQGCTVIGGEYSLSNGAPAGPWAGIDIEPNENNTIEDVTLIGVKTSGNQGAGLQITLGALSASINNRATINILGGLSVSDGNLNDASGIYFVNGGTQVNKIFGHVNVSGFLVDSPLSSGVKFRNWDADKCPSVSLTDVTVLNPDATANAPTNLGRTGFLLYCETAHATANLGNITLRNCHAEDLRVSPRMVWGAVVGADSGKTAKNIDIYGFTSINYTASSKADVATLGNTDNVSVEYPSSDKVDVSASTTIGGFGGKVINVTTSGVVMTLPLASSYTGMTYHVQNAPGTSSVQVAVQTGDIIRGLVDQASGGVVLDAGGSISLKSQGGISWIVEKAEGSFRRGGTSTAKQIWWALAAPVSGTWVRGDRIFNVEPSIGQPKSWVCTVAGTPGTWVSEGNL